MNKIFIFFALAILFAANEALALGVEATPNIIKISTDAGKSAEAKITIKNPSKEVSLYEVYADEFEDKFSFSSTSFILEAGERKEISVFVNSKKGGIFKTSISVVANSLTPNKFNVGSGVKIPVELSITEAQRNFKFSAAAFFSGINNSGLILLLASIILVFGIYRLTRKQI